MKIRGIEILKNYLTKEGLEVNNTLPKFFYEVEFDKPGGLVMPLIVEYSYADGSTERMTYPVQLWRKNEKSVRKVISSNKVLFGGSKT